MDVVELAESPRLPVLYGRAAAGLVPGRRPAGGDLPARTLVLRGVAADRTRLAEYARVCGFRLTDTLPPTYPHVLAFPLALALMTSPGFPFPAAGVVHLANRIELRRPLEAAEPLDLAVHAEALRPHDRGQQLDLVAVATADGAEVWRGVSTYLHRSRSATGGGSRPPAGGSAPAPAAIWRVGVDVGRAYAAVSGDRNPIHTSTLAARVFGFRRRIAHGMWTKARCLAQLAPRLPEAYAVSVTFQAPVLLPATVGFSATGSATGSAIGSAIGSAAVSGVGPPAGSGEPTVSFAVHDLRSGKPHLSGTLLPDPDRAGKVTDE